jgi:putative phage-type endonuclease
MIIHNHEQRSVEWFACRLGLPTASNFDKIVTSKGEASASAKKFLYQLVGEVLTGIKKETYTSPAMQHGIETEAEARKVYELVTCETVEEVGLCVSDCGRWGASPDGLVGNDGQIEIKCPNLETHHNYILSGKLPTDYIQQVQGQLLVTGRKWCDFVSYFPNLQPFIVRVYPDLEFQKILENALIKFDADLKKLVLQLRG